MSGPVQLDTRSRRRGNLPGGRGPGTRAEGVPGGSEGRRRAFHDVCADVLLVAKRHRLGRDVLNVVMIERLVERRGAWVISAAGEGSDDDSPTGKLMRQIIDAFAEY